MGGGTVISLRPYQADGVDRCRVALRSHGRVLYVAPTGSGKTVLFSHIARNAADRGVRVLILVHRRELWRQTSRTLEDCGVHHGVVAAGVDPTDSPIQIASVQTLVRRLDSLPDPDLIVVDECHHATSATYTSITKHYSSARVLGVSATPCRLSGRALGTAFDYLVQGPRYSSLIADGYLVPAYVLAPAKRPDLRGLASRGGDYVRDALVAAMDRPGITGDAVEHYIRHLNGRPCIAFCATVAHAEHVADQFTMAGFRAVPVDGSLSDEDRDRRIAGLSTGEVQVLTSCDLISEGLDVPAVQGVINLRPTKSTALYLQQVGRALRPAPGKDHAIILDHVGNCLAHGLPDQDREWSLDAGLVTRPKAQRDPDALDVRQCPNCYACHEWAPQCPYCSHSYKLTAQERRVAVRAGKLEPITDQEREVLLAHAHTLADYQRVAAAAGYKSGWAWHQWKRKQAQRRLQGVR